MSHGVTTNLIAVWACVGTIICLILAVVDAMRPTTKDKIQWVVSILWPLIPVVIVVVYLQVMWGRITYDNRTPRQIVIKKQ